MITIIKSDVPLAKTYTGTPDGGYIKGKSARVSEGTAVLHQVDTAAELVMLLRRVCAATDEALCPGAFMGASPGQEVRLLSETGLASLLRVNPPPGGVQKHEGRLVAARLKRGILPSHWLLLDADNPPGIPAAWAKMDIAARLAQWEVMIPGISACERVELRGSSARVGPGHPATHAWVRVSNPEFVAALKSYIGVAMVNRSLSFKFQKHSRVDPARVVGVESRGVFDLAVWDTGRLVFCSRPIFTRMTVEVADPDIRIVNEGAGPLDISWVRPPSARELESYRKTTNVRLRVSNGGLSTTSVGQLSWDTEIERRGQVRTLREWVADMSPDEKLRCESPFRESHSEAALIRLTEGGRPVVHDVGNGVTYYMPVVGHEIFEKVAYALGQPTHEFMVEADANVDVLNLMLTSCAWNPTQAKFMLADPERGIKVFPETKFEEFVTTAFGRVCKVDVGDRPPAEAKALRALPYRLIAAHVQYEAQFNTIVANVDMFAEGASVRVQDDRAILTLPHEPFEERAFDPAHVSDYLEHFPQFPQLLRFAAASRFAHNRKRTYLWMHCASDWGKSLFLSIFKDLRLSVNVSVDQIKQAFSGSPSGLTMADFRRAWVVAVDEFKGVTSEVKQLQGELQFSPKGLPMTTVPIYLKLFLSAEEVHSLASDTSGVEDQLANRFCRFMATGKINDRPLFNVNTEAYRQSIIGYAARELNALAEGYRRQGRIEASGAAEQYINEFYEQYRIDRSFARLSDSVEGFVQDFRDWVMAEHATGTSRLLGGRSFEYKGVVYLKAPTQVLNTWATENFDQAERWKVGHTAKAMIERMGGVIMNRFDRGVNTKAVLIGDLNQKEGDF